MLRFRRKSLVSVLGSAVPPNKVLARNAKLFVFYYHQCTSCHVLHLSRSVHAPFLLCEGTDRPIHLARGGHDPRLSRDYPSRCSTRSRILCPIPWARRSLSREGLSALALCKRVEVLAFPMAGMSNEKIIHHVYEMYVWTNISRLYYTYLVSEKEAIMVVAMRGVNPRIAYKMDRAMPRNIF